MAKEHERHEGAHKKKTMHGMTIHKTEKPGEHVIEHHYEDEDGKRSSKLATATTDMDDLHQHIDDHMGPDAEDAQAQPPDAAAAQTPPQPGAGAGEGAPPEAQE
jgi:hypothetical protein